MESFCTPAPIPLACMYEGGCKTATSEESEMKVNISRAKKLIQMDVFSCRQETTEASSCSFSTVVNLYLVSTGKLYGRGSTDDKGPVLAWLNALEAYQQTNQVHAQNVSYFFFYIQLSLAINVIQATNPCEASLLIQLIRGMMQ